MPATVAAAAATAAQAAAKPSVSHAHELPPSDTLEALPEGFWGETEAHSADPARAAATPGAGTDTAATIAAGRAPAAAQPEPPHAHAEGPGPGLEGGTIATLQRLFPGHVVRVEPAGRPVEDAADTDTEIESDADRDETPPREDDDRSSEPTDEDPPAHGLESLGSQRT